MKGIAIVLLLLFAALPSASSILARQVAAIGHDQVEAGAPGGATPIDTPVGTAATNEGGGSMGNEAQLLAQAGAIGILAVVLFFYRRDFFTKDERAREKAEAEKAELQERLRERKEDRDRLEDLLEKSNACITNSTVATSRQTDATHRLARTVENLERRAAGLSPTAEGNPA